MGAAIGAAAAIITTIITQAYERQRRNEERAEERILQLKAAYIEWQAAVHRAVLRTSQSRFVENNAENSQKMIDEIKQDHIISGVAIELLEWDAEARRRVKAAIDNYWDLGGKVPSAPKDIAAAMSKQISNAFEEVSEWLANTRFAPGYKPTPMLMPKATP